MKKKLMLMLPMLHQGGFERVAVATARLLSEDYDVSLCIFSDKDILYDVTGLRVINLDVPSRKNRAAKVVNVILRILRARRVKRENRIDITYSFGNTANPVNIFSRSGDRVITGLRCGTDLENPWIVRQCVRRSDLVLSCSAEISDLLARDFGCTRTATLYNPLDVEDIRARAAEPAGSGSAMAAVGGTDAAPAAQRDDPDVGCGPAPFVIVTMGRDDVIKAHWHLIKAFALVAAKHPEARLKIIGAGKYTAYRELARALGIADRVIFTGTLKNPFPEVAASDLYVLPSNREGFPNALIEAMALGLPVIATDCRTGPREIVLSEEEAAELAVRAPSGTSTGQTIRGKYGILIPDMPDVPDVDASHVEEGERILAEEIIRLMEDTAERKAYAGRSLERAKDFTPGRYREGLISILEAL